MLAMTIIEGNKVNHKFISLLHNDIVILSNSY